MAAITPKIKAALAHTRLLMLDVDGVLTDGSIVYTDNGGEVKSFNAKDGAGLRMAMAAGLTICIVTGRHSKALRHRCRDLGITHVFDGIREKSALLERIAEQTSIPPAQMAFVGDDLPDLALMQQVGLSVAVADAHPWVRSRAQWVTQARGGRGAVREVCDTILQAQGKWEALVESWR